MSESVAPPKPIPPQESPELDAWLAEAEAQGRRNAAERDAEVHRRVDWRHGDSQDQRILDPPRRGPAELPQTLEGVIGGGLIYIDESGQGVPQDAAWTHHAIRVVQDDQQRTEAALESATSDLAEEQRLRAERQQASAAAHAAYARLAIDEQQPHAVSLVESVVLGRRVRIVQDEPRARRMPVLLEGRGRGDSSPVARAYWAWQDRLAEVESGPRHDRRVVELADGRSMTRLAWLTDESGRLQARAGLCVRWLGLLTTHLERCGTPRPEPQPVAVIWRDADGSEIRELVPADLAANLVRF
jgi:hypothetical protein